MIKQFLCIFIVNYNTIFDLKKFKKKKNKKNNFINFWFYYE